MQTAICSPAVFDTPAGPFKRLSAALFPRAFVSYTSHVANPPLGEDLSDTALQMAPRLPVSAGLLSVPSRLSTRPPDCIMHVHYNLSLMSRAIDCFQLVNMFFSTTCPAAHPSLPPAPPPRLAAFPPLAPCAACRCATRASSTAASTTRGPMPPTWRTPTSPTTSCRCGAVPWQQTVTDSTILLRFRHSV